MAYLADLGASSYGLFAAAAMLAYYLFIKGGESRFALKRGTAELFSVLALPLSVLLARLIFCLTDHLYFFDTIAQPLKMLDFAGGGYAMTGALLGVVLAALLTARLTHAPFGRMMDLAATFLPIPIIILRLAEPHASLGLGREVVNGFLRSSAFFAFSDEMETLRHAVFRYEAAVALGILIIMLIIMNRKWRPGNKALVFFTLYGAAQVVLESMRDDFHLLWGFVRAQQIFSIFMPVTAIVIFSMRLIKSGGINRRLIAAWLAAAAGIALGIIKEFDVDTSQNLFMDYGLMIVAVAVLAAVALWLMKKTLPEDAPLPLDTSAL